MSRVCDLSDNKTSTFGSKTVGTPTRKRLRSGSNYDTYDLSLGGSQVPGKYNRHVLKDQVFCSEISRVF